MNILSCNYNHDGSAAILKDGKISAYLNTERFCRIKKCPGATKEVIDELLKIADLAPSDIDLLVLNNLNYMFSPIYYSENNGYYQDLWENFLIEDIDTNGKKTFVDIKNYGLDTDNKDFFPKLKNIQIGFETYAFFRGFRRPCIINLPHYLIHASTVYYSSPFQSSMIFVWDPTGFEAFIGKGNKVYPIFNDRSLNMANLGFVYAETSEEILSESSLTSAGKMMGLSAYGSKSVKKQAFDYSLFLNRNYNRINEVLKNESSSKTAEFYEEKGKKLNASKAFVCQSIFENQLEYMFKLLYQYSLIHGVEPNICLSGGSTLNCIANEKAFKNSKFKNIFLHPACGDDGTSIGGALAIWHNKCNSPKEKYSNKELMYTKKEYTLIEIQKATTKFKDKIDLKVDLNCIDSCANALTEGKIIAWFDGGAEIGPRALGHRSILADPRSDKVRDFLNQDVKGRETYRPLAPSILEEYSEEWFGIKDSPFMLRAAKILKDSLPGISHVDNTSRPQTVNKDDNPNYYSLINKFFKKTNVPMILDTSFNIKGEPIVESPENAIKSFIESKIDILVFPSHNFIISKR